MIFGIGVDVLESERIARTLERYGRRFVDHLLMPAEHAQLERTARPARFLAMRFAAKEAIVKGMGTGFAHGIWIRDVGVVQNAWGKPEVIYSARGAKVRDFFRQTRTFSFGFGAAGNHREIDPERADIHRCFC